MRLLSIGGGDEVFASGGLNDSPGAAGANRRAEGAMPTRRNEDAPVETPYEYQKTTPTMRQDHTSPPRQTAVICRGDCCDPVGINVAFERPRDSASTAVN